MKYTGSIYLQVEYPSGLSFEEKHNFVNEAAQQAVLEDSSYYLQKYSWSWNKANTIEKHKFFIHTDQDKLKIPLEGVIDPWTTYTISFTVHSMFIEEIKSYYNQLQK